MIRNIIMISLFSFFLFSCSGENCSEEKESINKYYDSQVQQVKNNGKDSPMGIDYRQISLLEAERDKKLNEACN